MILTKPEVVGYEDHYEPEEKLGHLYDRLARNVAKAKRNGDISKLHWRLNNMYVVKDIESGTARIFKMSEDHEKFYRDLFVNPVTRRLIVIKARQVFMTTWSIIQMIDQCVHMRNARCMVSNWSTEQAQLTLEEKAAYICEMTPWIKALRPDTQTKVVKFPRMGSRLIVNVTGRGSHSDNILITEFSKTSNLYPDKAREVIAGMLPGAEYGTQIIESTGKGSRGIFPDLVRKAHADWLAGGTLNRKKWRLRFIGWQNKSLNRLDLGYRDYPQELDRYFDEAEADIREKLDEGQRNWYYSELHNTHNDDWRAMKQEQPTTIEEALSTDMSAYVIREYVQDMAENGRVAEFPYRQDAKTVCFWDFGFSDSTVCTFVQKAADSDYYTIVDAIKSSKRRLDYYFSEMNKRDYNVSWHVLPWDSEQRDSQVKERLTENRSDSIKAHFFRAGMRNVKVLPKISNKRAGFEAVRGIMNRLRVNKDLTFVLDDLMNVRKQYHTNTSHYADKLAEGAQENHVYDTVELLARTMTRYPELWSEHSRLVTLMDPERPARMVRTALGMKSHHRLI